MNRRRRRWPLLIAGCALCQPAFADDFADWQVSGANTARIESYTVRGDPASGPYQFTGAQYYDEINLSVRKLLSPYDKLTGQLFLLANHSDYRSADKGLVPERVSLAREKGDGDVPYRAEAGDTFAYFSYRTLQRSLKGVQLELQPTPGESGLRQSLVFVSGANQPSWRHVQGRDDWTTGLSWLAEFGASHVSANAVYNLRQADPVAGTLERKQTVASLAADSAWQWDTYRLRIEGELAGLHGDHEGFADATGAIAQDSGRDRRGTAAFAQLSGQSTAAPLDYRLRYERNDRDFRPANAVVAPDRESEEAHVGWRFADGLSLRARAQHYIDGLQGGNELRTSTYGFTLAGPFITGPAGLTGNVDAFRQDLRKQDSSIDRGIWNLNANFAKALPDQWTGNLGLFVQQVDDRVAGAPDTTSTQVQLGATHAVSFGGWSGSFTPGISMRRTHGDASATKEWSPSLALALSRERSSFSASYGYQKLQPNDGTLATITVNALRLDYRYSVGRNTFGIEASAYDRRVTIGQYNDTYRVAATWTYSFDKPAQYVARATTTAAPSGALPRDVILLAGIAPGSDLDGALARLAEAGLRGETRQGDAVVYEQRLIDDLVERQRVAVEHGAGRVKRVALVIGLDDPNNASAVAQTFERVRKALLDRYGAPAFSLEEGAIAPTLVADLNAGRVIRVMEWQTSTGKLRLGIPRRLDGQVRIEVQHAANFGSPRDTLWSVEAVR